MIIMIRVHHLTVESQHTPAGVPLVLSAGSAPAEEQTPSRSCRRTCETQHETRSRSYLRQALPQANVW